MAVIDQKESMLESLRKRYQKRMEKFRKQYEQRREFYRLLRENASDILHSANFQKTRHHIQHGTMQQGTGAWMQGTGSDPGGIAS